MYNRRSKMKHLKKFLKDLWQDESGQGATEYILILVVLGVVIIAFREKLAELFKDRTGQVSEKLMESINKAGG